MNDFWSTINVYKFWQPFDTIFNQKSEVYEFVGIFANLLSKNCPSVKKTLQNLKFQYAFVFLERKLEFFFSKFNIKSKKNYLLKII